VRYLKRLTTAAGFTCLAAALFAVAAPPALADYGTGAQYQVEISANNAGLNDAGTEQGDVTWTAADGMLTITGVALVDGMFPVTIVVPDTYGHYVRASDSVIQDFALGQIGGTAQVQVAP
jgi:hypothetical protein